MLFLRLIYLVKNTSLFVVTYLCPAPKNLLPTHLQPLPSQLLSDHFCFSKTSFILYQNLLLFLPYPQLLHSRTFLPSLHSLPNFHPPQRGCVGSLGHTDWDKFLAGVTVRKGAQYPTLPLQWLINTPIRVRLCLVS